MKDTQIRTKQNNRRIAPYPPAKPPSYTIRPLFPLPTLTTKNPSNIIDIRVLTNPTTEEKWGHTWVVEEQPAQQVGTGSHFRLIAEGRVSGIGRLGHVVTMKKHWITFKINNTKQISTLRIPTSWAKLSDLESHTHATRYDSLPDLPRPHQCFQASPSFKKQNENPYEFDRNEDSGSLEKKLYKISNTRPAALHASKETN